jgi:hypothetical protein
MNKKMNIVKLLLSVFVLLSMTNTFSRNIAESRAEKILSVSMTQSLEKFLSLTNYLERHKYIYRHDAREILAVFNTSEVVDVERINEFGATVDSLKEEILQNVRVKQDVKERVDSQINEILTSIQLALTKREAIFNNIRTKQQVAGSERRINEAKAIRNASPKIIVRKEKSSNIVPIALGGTLLVLMGVFLFERRSQFKKINDLKNKLSASFKRRKQLEKGHTVASSFKKVLKNLDSPMSVVVDLNGKVLSSTKSFEGYFGKYFNSTGENWDQFFEENFYLSKDENDETGSYKYKRDTFSRIFITSQLIENESIRFMTFRLINTEELLSLKQSTVSSLENGVNSANEIFEGALTEFSKLYQLRNIQLNEREIEDEIKTYSNKEDLKDMFIKVLTLLNTVQEKITKDEKIVVGLKRVDGILSLSAVIDGVNFSLDMNEEVKDAIRNVSTFVSEYDGELVLKKQNLREGSRTVFDLRIYDQETAFNNKISTVVENEVIN